MKIKIKELKRLIKEATAADPESPTSAAGTKALKDLAEHIGTMLATHLEEVTAIFDRVRRSNPHDRGANTDAKEAVDAAKKRLDAFRQGAWRGTDTASTRASLIALAGEAAQRGQKREEFYRSEIEGLRMTARGLGQASRFAGRAAPRQSSSGFGGSGNSEERRLLGLVGKIRDQGHRLKGLVDAARRSSD